jgi:HSP20 family molecular chaperone IbpA
MKTIERSKMKLKLEYGAPMIARVEYGDLAFRLEVLIPGVSDGTMAIVADEEKIMIEHEIDERFVGIFKFYLYSEDVNFTGVQVAKKDGILYLEVPYKELKSDPKMIIV